MRFDRFHNANGDASACDAEQRAEYDVGGVVHGQIQARERDNRSRRHGDRLQPAMRERRQAYHGRGSE